MAPTFGTSGLRGLVVDLTPDVVRAYIEAYVEACPTGGQVFVGRDLRPSSTQIAAFVIAAVREAGCDAVDCGAVPTPALAQASIDAGAGAVMVTGSHIPADRNGLKFYVPSGEITKDDEDRIATAYAQGKRPTTDHIGALRTLDAMQPYADRLVRGFGADALRGVRIGIYRHSSVARDVLQDVLERLGACVVPLGHSDVFIPVDTEAVDPAIRAMLAEWGAGHALDAVVSTDGDGDRPLVADGTGRIVPGDILGVLTSRRLAATDIVTPVSSNDVVNQMDFARVTLTRIGSPFVVAGIKGRLAEDPAARVVGFEANGGFVLGFTTPDLPALMTRDGILPIIAALSLAVTQGCSLADLISDLPDCYTATDRVQKIHRGRAATFLAELCADQDVRSAFFADVGDITRIDQMDGLRLTFADGRVVHLRPSGNAPEFRIYAQAGTVAGAEDLVAIYLDRISDRVL